MLKGCQKRMVYIKNTGCDLFDEAYFILKNDVPTDSDTENDIIRIATAIINENGFVQKKKRKKKRLKGLLLLALGAIIGVAVCSTIFAIIF